jgi:hypothetical protein
MGDETSDPILSSTCDAACDCADVAAYLDGELGVAEGEAFERHVASCRTCADSLAEQRRLLCLLDAAFARAQKKVELPEDFVRVVKARAQTDVSGVRRRGERRRAALYAASLALLACAILGVRFASFGLAPLRAAASAALSVGDMILHSLAEVFAGLLFILRGVGCMLATEPRSGGLLVVILLGCALALLTRLVIAYHRERLHD